MGSAEMADKAPQKANDTKNPLKSIFHLIQSSFHKGARKKGKERKNNETEIEETPQNHEPIVVTDVKWLIENVDKLTIKKDDTKVGEDDEIKSNFTIKTVKVKNTERSASNSSDDSGFSEKSVLKEKNNDVTEIENKSFSKKFVPKSKENSESEDISRDFEKLEIKGAANKDNGKKKKLQTVFLSRGPLRNNYNNYADLPHPYQQTSKQINRHTFSGGQVTVNESLEIDNAVLSVDASVENFNGMTVEERNKWFEDAKTFLEDKWPLLGFDPNEILGNTASDTTLVFPQENFGNSVIDTTLIFPQNNYMRNYTTYEPTNDPSNIPYVFPNNKDLLLSNSLLTPPRSNEAVQMEPNFYSPKYTNYPNVLNNSPLTDYQSSPERSPNSFQIDAVETSLDLEEDQIPRCVGAAEFVAIVTHNGKAKEKVRRSSSISMKTIKEMQRELQSEFSRNVCCKNDRVPIQKIFHEHFNKLSAEQRKVMFLRISKMDFKTAYGVLHHILKGLTQESRETDSLQYALFYSICQQVLAQKPAMYLNEFGLNLLVAAALGCHERPELTRMLVHCIRSAHKYDKADVAFGGPIFTEVDGRGDNLVGACARSGDTHAAVLAEMLLKGTGDMALFDVGHTNTEGYTALHVACLAHNSTEAGTCLQIVHILLAHGGADIAKGDMKVGDTALHLAVNSVHCDMKLVQALFLHIDRKHWKQYAQATNRSSVSPLEYARSATKSSVRQNYPTEVLDMLKKCR